LEKDDVFQAAGAITLYGAAVSGLQIGLAAVVKCIQAAAYGFMKSRGAAQENGDAGLTSFYLLDDTAYG